MCSCLRKAREKNEYNEKKRLFILMKIKCNIQKIIASFE